MKFVLAAMLLLFSGAEAGAISKELLIQFRDSLEHIAGLHIERAKVSRAIDYASSINSEGVAYKDEWHSVEDLKILRDNISDSLADARNDLAQGFGDAVFVLEVDIFENITESYQVANSYQTQPVGYFQTLRTAIDLLREDAGSEVKKQMVVEKLMANYNFSLLENFRGYSSGDVSPEAESILPLDEFFNLFYFVFHHNVPGTAASANYRLTGMRVLREGIVSKWRDLRQLRRLVRKLENSYQEQIVMMAIMLGIPAKDLFILPLVHSQPQVDYVKDHVIRALKNGLPLKFNFEHIDPVVLINLEMEDEKAKKNCDDLIR